MKFKYSQWMPKLIITREMLQAFVDRDAPTLHLLINWKPWEFSPLQCQDWFPSPGQTPQTFRTRPYFQSWWKMMALREKLMDLAEREHIVPTKPKKLLKVG
jgi:hypothetical protein